ncbi:MAG: molybdopterin-synthase adenylyltransferase MoeB [Chthoniobacterales bacterium]
MKDGIIPSERIAAVALDRKELARYSRHLLMPEVTLEGQRRLKAARVLCIGAGGLGSSAAFYLTAAGLGVLGLVDEDRVELSNLQRQILHGTSDIGRAKLASAKDRLQHLNSHVEIELHACRFSSSNAPQIIANYDVVIDGSDNFATRYLSNDVCVFGRKPNVYGSVFRFEGQTTVFAPHLGGSCYRCLFPTPPAPGTVPGCSEAGVLGVVPGIIGMMQALEAIKLILGLGNSLVGRLVHFDAEKFKFREFNLRRDPECPVCGEHPTISAPIDYELFCGQRGVVEEEVTPVRPISPEQVTARLGDPGSLALLDVREPYEHALGSIEEAQLIPLGDVEARMREIPRDRDVVVYCRVGTRSAHAIDLLQQAGFTNLYNLAGGIEAWSDYVDRLSAK